MTITLTLPRLPCLPSGGDPGRVLRALLPMAELVIPVLAEARGASLLLRLALVIVVKIARSALRA
jgi:hypothetical protein